MIWRERPNVAVYQAPWELAQLLNLVAIANPSRVLEVGCYEGGTLWSWIQYADTVVAIDDVCRNADDWQDWADQAGCTLHTLHGSSHDPTIIGQADFAGPYDLVFIDADHTFDAVREDVDNYRPMVAPGGALVLHDILPRPSYGVSRVWEELRNEPGARFIEICENAVQPGNEGRCGIGVVWL